MSLRAHATRTRAENRIISARARDARATALLAVVVLLGVLWSVTAMSRPAAATTCLPGTGTDGDPFLVASQADLAKVGSRTDGCDEDLEYRQTADISLTGSWTPLTPIAPFSGVYDGDGHTISGLTVSGGSAYRGLFARATTDAEFRDLTLSGVMVEGTGETGGLVGDLADGSVTDVTVTGSVSSTGSFAGGIAGSARGATLTRVRFEGTVSATGGGTEIGGLVGRLGNGTIIDATVEATVSSQHRGTGGVAGSIGDNGTIRRARFDGTVSMTGSTEVGGIVGQANAATIDEVHASGAVTGPTVVGGLIGGLASGADEASVTGSSFSGTVTASGQTAGGLIGQASGAPAIVASWSTGSVAATLNAGGLVGFMTGGSVTASYSTASVAITDAGAADPDLGGLLGFIADVDVTDSYARGDLTNAGAKRGMGGLVGDMSNSDPDNRVRTSYATGSVPGSHATVGGLTGGAGDVFVDSFWDTETTGQAASAGSPDVTGRTTAQMRTLATFSTWRIVNGWQPYSAGVRTWGICPRVNDGYPFLLWQYDSDPCTDPVAAAAPTLSVTCAGDADGTLPIGTPIACSLTGADADIDILWRAAYNPTFAEGVLRTATDGTGTLTLTLPAAAAGSPITVELVAWTAPIPVGTAAGTAANGPVPTGIPAGDGPTTPTPLGLMTVAALLGLGLAAAAPATTRTTVPTP